ncbi:hypothetical protein V6N11_047199 [Hibiscus sabdariffa]|uniref:Uncharacterized protein n=1 Tax=Hibiscus sabdariffa TaxID=183260 RepID=A0ABR2AB83_9ROSI
MVKGFCPCSDFVISFACDGFYGYGEEANVQLKLATSKGVVFYLSVDGTTVMMMLSFLSYQIEMANILEKLGMSRYDLFSLDVEKVSSSRRRQQIYNSCRVHVGWCSSIAGYAWLATWVVQEEARLAATWVVQGKENFT